MIRVMTWNVNGVRARLSELVACLEAWRPDVVCLQEIKVETALFPAAELTKLGYPHQSISGQKGYHGVAILSRIPFVREFRLRPCDGPDHRHLAVAFRGGLELHNIYVPKGGHEPDPDVNPAFAYKLHFLSDLAAWFSDNRSPRRRMVLVGDFNVAPLPSDVWNHRRAQKLVGHSPPEVAALARLQSSLGWIDGARRYVDPDEPLYTWWGYRMPEAFAKGYGWRLDHVWLTAPVASRLRSVVVLAGQRASPRPSDHVPVIADLDRLPGVRANLP